jgi:hypothetical protein
MYRANVTIKGNAPLSCSKQHRSAFLDGESHEEYDARTWREKANYDALGIVFVPAMAFKQAMDLAAKRLAIPDPDNKRANFTKYFISDVICEKNLSIGIHKDKMPPVTINANVDGVRGSGKRVPRIFPQTQEWGGKISFLIMEEKIKPEHFEKVLNNAGRSIGVGQFRPEKGGLNGRFEVTKVEYEKVL